MGSTPVAVAIVNASINQNTRRFRPVKPSSRKPHTT